MSRSLLLNERWRRYNSYEQSGSDVNRGPRATLIYNPLAGTIGVASAVESIVAFWRHRGWQVNVQHTEYAGHARELAQEAAESDREMVLVAGGDGTLGEVASGLVHSDTVLALLPAGTGNSLAKELGIPLWGPLNRRGILEACAVLADGRVQRMDVGSCNEDMYWLQWAGTGIDGFIVERIEPRSKLIRKLGVPGYLAQGLAAIPKFPGMQAIVQVDGQTFADDFVMVTISNCRRYAGGQFTLNPTAVLDDGLFDIWLFRGDGTLRILNYIVRVASGRHLNCPGISRLACREVAIDVDPPMPFHRDGDPAGMTPIRCRVVTGGLRVLVPSTTPEGLFSRRGEMLA